MQHVKGTGKDSLTKHVKGMPAVDVASFNSMHTFTCVFVPLGW